MDAKLQIEFNTSFVASVDMEDLEVESRTWDEAEFDQEFYRMSEHYIEATEEELIELLSTSGWPIPTGYESEGDDYPY